MNELIKKFMAHSDFAETLPLFEKDDCIYTSCYCEENIYKLCEKINNDSCEAIKKCYVVFVSNDVQRVPLWLQRVGKAPENLVFWDYHVFLIFNDSKESFVYDFDTCLPFPTPLMKYCAMTFKMNKYQENEYFRYPMFRVIESLVYLEKFSSDRSHMLKNGKWIKEPPKYPPIISSESQNNLDAFIAMNKNIGYGEVMKLSELIKVFTNSIEGEKS